MRREENRVAHKSVGSKIKSLQAKRVDYKEQVLSVLQYKGLQCLWLRITFWINKLIKLLHRPKQERYDKPVMNFEILGVHKTQIMSVILFLKY